MLNCHVRDKAVVAFELYVKSNKHTRKYLLCGVKNNKKVIKLGFNHNILELGSKILDYYITT